MQLNYIAKDDKGNVGQQIPLTQGESRNISIFLFNSDGTPFTYSGTISELLLKIFSTINQASIQKKYSLSQVTPITESGGASSNLIGFSFNLAAADTGSMAPNNSGLPMTATVTDSGGNTFELDFISLFNVTVPVVLT
jgi:hypothetical protein